MIFLLLRSDTKRTRYIGALCGLGYVEDRGSPIMPEHDIEVTFDVKFSEYDFFMVSLKLLGFSRYFDID